ncbi:hypothetical protein Pcac1_g8955 [Phytophthora cactorum]|uniref:Uncharacterized protein n=1 Tax=Phytophthora cactorum TaxID=29920 RepID=A0A8T0ZEI0_9STRA|nr:hypothetical protein Pcac1_g8955 [Phytophthora cactorum]KAG2832947.1 hypothetical protein PC111_g6407 [Phytophthora cactorum]KAG2860710.1 hypothetical protein PC113_g7821 [Phytophthora cactorum]KAG2915563.1 hypothetical protein PC114_g7800 [Phytophthora cactorum]KAG2930259.1 hypothetical protein PC115_g6585 [Phytophthora cactorum]
MMNHVPATLRKMYVQQANEKVMVKKELELLDHYKLVCVWGGGGLIKQDWDVTMSNVNKHLELIENELTDIHHTSDNGTVLVDPAVIERNAQVCSSTSDITAKLSASSSARRQELQARLYCEAALSARSAELFAILGGDAAENFDTAIDASSTRPTIQTTAREQQKVAEQFCNDVVSARADHFMRTNSASWSSALALAKPHANGRGRPVIATESRSATSGAAGTWPTEDRCARRTRLGQPANTQGADSN